MFFKDFLALLHRGGSAPERQSYLHQTEMHMHLPHCRSRGASHLAALLDGYRRSQRPRPAGWVASSFFLPSFT